MKSDQINELAVALAAAQGEFSAVPKESANPFFKSTYAALPDVVKHTAPVLAKHGLSVSQFIDHDGTYDMLTTYLLHTSGQFISHSMRLYLVKDDPQAQGSAVTYARRYSYMSVLGLVADNDDDGNAASNRGGNARPTPQRAPQGNTGASQPVGDKSPAEPQLIAYLQKADKLSQASKEPNETLHDITERAERYPLTAKQVGLAKRLADEVIRNHGLDPAKEFLG